MSVYSILNSFSCATITRRLSRFLTTGALVALVEGALDDLIDLIEGALLLDLIEGALVDLGFSIRSPPLS